MMIGGKQVDHYPLQMVHPHARKATSTAVQGNDPVSGKPFIDYKGSPDIFPPLTVANYDSEIAARKNGYKAVGEPHDTFEYAEYPLWLRHPDYRPAVPAVHAIMGRDNVVIRDGIPAVPAVMPDVMASTPEEEEKWSERGYRRQGEANSLAAESLTAHINLDYEPKADGWDDDTVERTSSGLPKYPMWCHGELAVDRAHELRILTKHGIMVKEPDPKELARARRELLLKQLSETEAFLGETLENPTSRMRATENAAVATAELQRQQDEPRELTRSEKIKAGLAAKKAREASAA